MIDFSVDIGTTPKAGSSDAENEDVARSRVFERGLRIAVADGATESSYAGEWATAIVNAWIDDGAELTEVLSRAERTWAQSLPHRDSLPWFGQAKLDEGSAATALLATVNPVHGGFNWEAAAIGDCELFALSKRRRTFSLVRATPLADSNLFNNTPELARTSFLGTWASYRGFVRGPAELWLATDALAQSLLHAKEAGRPAWHAWSDALAEPESFAAQVADWRSSRLLRNDDTTLLRVRLP